jgi:pimeloyl-ACP methyl ester carboxylesterase
MKTWNGCALALTMAAALLMSSTAHAQPTACASRQSGDGARVEEAGFVSLGGLEQWVTIRGDDWGNPVLLHIHGGPGVAFSAFTAEFAPYERDFIVVQWDQRGSGCTFGRYGDATPEVTLDRIASDGIELATQLRTRFDNRKIIVLGHSFGSIVATEIVRRAPEHFALYVGTAQVASFARALEAQLAHLRGVAAGDADLTAQLDALAALDSQSLQKFGGVNRILQGGGHLPAVDVAWLQRLPARAAEVMAPKDLADWQAGRQASGSQLLRQIAGVDLFATARRFELPFVVIQGSDDLITPTSLARAYVDHVAAPVKEVIIIDGASHFPHLTHGEQFLSALRDFARRSSR